MRSFLLKWLVYSIALLIVIHIFSGVRSESLMTTIVMALVLGLLNAFLKPIMSFLSLPIIIITLGLFTFIINALVFYLAGMFVHGFYVSGFWSAFWAALLFSIFTFLINLLVKSDKSNKSIF
ncbi:MAG: phage holin family protein [Ignavibacteria bacterium]|jgi:putative membrane protein